MYIMIQNIMCYITEISTLMRNGYLHLCFTNIKMCYVTFAGFITLSAVFLPGVSDFGNFLAV